MVAAEQVEKASGGKLNDSVLANEFYTRSFVTQEPGLGAAIASRKDALFAAKKAKQAEVAGLTSVAALAAYDVAVGWE